MTLPLNKEMLGAMYSYLSATPPFNKWNLPDAEEIKFTVIRAKGVHGRYVTDRKGWREIQISSASVGYTPSLSETMAHEMIHLFEDVSGPFNKSEHTEAFRKYAKLVCKYHGFDPKTFY